MIDFLVDGMTCGACVRTVTRALKAVDPAANVEVDLAAKRVRVDSRSSADSLGAALAKAGFPVAAAGEPAAMTRKKGCCCSA